MKSKKIVALIVAFAAFMAVATSGLAAVQTTTSYLTGTDKVSVKAEVTGAEAGKEVTYLVKNNASPAAIVYIDQQTADKDGKAIFDYKIAKDKISDLVTAVSLGTNGTEIDKTGKEIGFAGVDVKSDGYVSVKFYAGPTSETEIENVGGTLDTIYVGVTAIGEREIDTVIVDGTQQNIDSRYPVPYGKTIEITTKESEKENNVVINENLIEAVPELEGEYANKEIYNFETFALKVTGSPQKIGVECGGTIYPALTVDGDSYNENDIYAVRIITDKNTSIGTATPVYDWEE